MGGEVLGERITVSDIEEGGDGTYHRRPGGEFFDSFAPLLTRSNRRAIGYHNWPRMMLLSLIRLLASLTLTCFPEIVCN